jgi:hypothetical protein
MVKTMKRYAIIENELVVNIAVSETALADNWTEIPDHAGIGSSFVNGEFSQFPDLTDKPNEPTNEELLEQLQALMDKVNALPN